MSAATSSIVSWLERLSLCCWWQLGIAAIVGLLLGLYFLNLGPLLGAPVWDPPSRRSGRQSRLMETAEGENECKMVLCVRNDLPMGKGKIAAQCCHAALGAYRQVQEAIAAGETARRLGAPQGAPINKMVTHARLALWLARWEAAGEAKIVVKLPDATAAMEVLKMARSEGINAYSVHDAGRTQVPRGSLTAIAVGPAPASLIDKVTGNLKLL